MNVDVEIHEDGLASNEDVHPIEIEMSISGTVITQSVRAGRFRAKQEINVGDVLSKSLNGGDALKTWDKALLQGLQVNSVLRNPSRNCNVIDLFCGCGGFSTGVKQAITSVGLTPNFVLAADKEVNSLKIYKENFPNTTLSHDNLNHAFDFQVLKRKGVASFLGRPEILNKNISHLKEKIDIVIAGPPCQGHSNLNNSTRRDDPRNLLYLVPVAAAVALDAPLLIIENVPEVTKDHGDIVKIAQSILEKEGYSITEGLINGTHVGLAQTRRRHFLVASKHSSPSLKSAIHACKSPPRDLLWAIEDLQEIDRSELIDKPSELSSVNLARIKFLFKNNLYELPAQERPDCHKNGHTYGSVYGRLKWDEPCGTITTGFLSPGRGRYIHPEQKRCLTPHEGARIQGFPDLFKFTLADEVLNRRIRIAKWVGDAVPPKFGFVAALAALSTLQD
jgi:DNA (cytosine-5)-methyltransferase 1